MMNFVLKKYKWVAALYCPLLFAFFLTGCGTMLTKNGQAVCITNDYGDVVGCKYLGRVISSSQLAGYGLEKKGVSSAYNELKNKAAQLGANMLVIQNVAGGNIYTEMTGDAYQCAEQ
jgi:hypothetical protein